MEATAADESPIPPPAPPPSLSSSPDPKPASPDVRLRRDCFLRFFLGDLASGKSGEAGVGECVSK